MFAMVGEVGDYNCERVTKGFAKGLLARIALFAGGWSIRDGNQFSDANVEHYPNLENNPGMKEMNNYYVGRTKDWRKYYEIAEEQCAEIIGDPQNPHQLDPDYGNIWKTVCHLDYNPYNENMFEVANGLGYSGDIGSLMGSVWIISLKILVVHMHAQMPFIFTLFSLKTNVVIMRAIGLLIKRIIHMLGKLWGITLWE